MAPKRRLASVDIARRKRNFPLQHRAIRSVPASGQGRAISEVVASLMQGLASTLDVRRAVAGEGPVNAPRCLGSPPVALSVRVFRWHERDQLEVDARSENDERVACLAAGVYTARIEMEGLCESDGWFFMPRVGHKENDVIEGWNLAHGCCFAPMRIAFARSLLVLDYISGAENAFGQLWEFLECRSFSDATESRCRCSERKISLSMG